MGYEEHREHVNHAGSKEEYITAALGQMPDTLTDAQQDQIVGIIGDVYDTVARHEGLMLCACEQRVMENQKSGKCYVMGFVFEVHNHDEMREFVNAAAGQIVNNARSN